ncbi:MAG TPA: phosphohydrolase [Porticoccaceae bacterium]|nr:phosphohydrolase [Porticoccaceae bacterium]
MAGATLEIAAAILYLCAFVLQVMTVRGNDAQATMKSKPSRSLLTLALAAMALLIHLKLSFHQLVGDSGFDFSLLPVSVALFAVINLIVITSCLHQPMHNLFLLLFPATALALVVSALYYREPAATRILAPGLGAHILLSLVAYSLLTVAALEALFLAYQNRQLHQHHSSVLMRILPPLQTMESLLFSVLGTGFVLLTLALITGFVFVEDLLAQHLVHKTVFSLLAWLVYAILMWGRFKLGWRGKIATYWTLGGFFALMLAFWGSKFVLEVLLSQPTSG